MHKRKVGRRVIRELSETNWDTIQQTLANNNLPKHQLAIFELFKHTNNTPQRVGSIKKGYLDLREIQKINNVLYDAGINFKIMSIQETAKAPATDLYKFYEILYL